MYLSKPEEGRPSTKGVGLKKNQFYGGQPARITMGGYVRRFLNEKVILKKIMCAPVMLGNRSHVSIKGEDGVWNGKGRSEHVGGDDKKGREKACQCDA